MLRVVIFVSEGFSCRINHDWIYHIPVRLKVLIPHKGEVFSAVLELLFQKVLSDASTVLSVFLITTRKFKDFFHFVPCSDCSWRTKWVDLFKDGGSKRILSLQARDKVNMLRDKTKNLQIFVAKFAWKEISSQGMQTNNSVASLYRASRGLFPAWLLAHAELFIASLSFAL